MNHQLLCTEIYVCILFMLHATLPSDVCKQICPQFFLKCVELSFFVMQNLILKMILEKIIRQTQCKLVDMEYHIFYP